MGIGAGAAAIAAAAIGAGGSIIAGGEQSSGASSAANTQLSMYNQTRSDLMPYMNAGTGALSSLQNLMGLGPGGNGQPNLQALQNYPGYQWAYGQGLQAVDQSAASRGLLLSGGQLAATQQYGQGMADQLFGTYYGQLSNIAQMGQNSAAQVGQQGTQAAANAGQAQYAAGTANASSIAGATNQIGGLLNNSTLQYLLSGDSSAVSPTVNGALADSGTFNYSDRRLKTDVKRVGVLDSGLPVYSYRFKGSSLPQMGVMADEVERVAPGAVHVDRQSGYKKVDYRKVSELPRMRKAA